MYCISQVLRNEVGFIVNAGQFFAAEEGSLNAVAEANTSGFPNRGKLVEYNLEGEIVKIYEDISATADKPFRHHSSHR